MSKKWYDPPTVRINPEFHEQLSGTCSQIAFTNLDFVAGLRCMFRASDNERIKQIEIYDDRIKAVFEIVPKPKQRKPQ